MRTIGCFVRTYAKAIAGGVVALGSFLVVHSGIALPVGWEASIQVGLPVLAVYFIPNTDCPPEVKP